MAQAIDEEMIDNRDEQKDDLRADLHMLLDELRRIRSGIVPEVERFLKGTIAQPALDQIPKLRGWIRRVQNVKAHSCAHSCVQGGQQKQKATRGGLKYIVGHNGEAPKMQAIHCAFAKMAAEEIQKNSCVVGATLIQMWNERHSAAWRHRQSKRKSHGGKAGNGEANCFLAINCLKWRTCAVLRRESRRIPLS
jgi:hypothetical protein